MYDIIGDIHGHGSALAELLQKLDYTEQKMAYFNILIEKPSS